MGIFDTVKGMFDIATKLNNMELNRLLVAMQADLMRMQDENSKLKEENESLKQKQKLSREMIIGKNSYWISKDDSWDGPYCTGCWDRNKQPVRLNDMPYQFRSMGTHRCPSCQSHIAHPAPPEKSPIL